MHFSLFAAGFALLLRLPPLVGGAATNTTRTVITPGTLHSLTESYSFDSRSDWETVMVTNLRYKYRRSRTPPSATAPGQSSNSVLKRPSGINTPRKNFFRSLGDSIAGLTKGIMGYGKADAVSITWYSGHDLLNPSCWSNSKWAPTDKSFVAAVTLDGWTGKPQCFDFLELCSNSTRCTFVRVVDTCAGCEKGSKHVDLTQAPFEQLASLDKGILTVQMRRASEPLNWDVELWGPRDN